VDQVQKCVVAVEELQVTQVHILRKQLQWQMVVTFVQLSVCHVVTQTHYVLEVVLNQLRYVGLVMADQTDVYVLRVELVDTVGVQLVTQFTVVQ